MVITTLSRRSQASRCNGWYLGAQSPDYCGNLKELRPGSRGRSEIGILFVFDPWRSAILLVVGDKAGSWNRWYARMIPRAEQLYEIYLKERAAEEGSQ
jgi:hypothetical protein